MYEVGEESDNTSACLKTFAARWRLYRDEIVRDAPFLRKQT
jgi:hypothetical protein